MSITITGPTPVTFGQVLSNVQVLRYVYDGANNTGTVFYGAAVGGPAKAAQHVLSASDEQMLATLLANAISVQEGWGPGTANTVTS